MSTEKLLTIVREMKIDIDIEQLRKDARGEILSDKTGIV
jgi:hypothetical protein